jgi:hypothetical protein
MSINASTAQAHTLLHIRKTGHSPPRRSSADFWILTTANTAGTNGLKCLPKHGGALDYHHPKTDQRCLTFANARWSVLTTGPSSSFTLYQNDLVMTNTADVTSGKAIAVWSQSFSGVSAVRIKTNKWCIITILTVHVDINSFKWRNNHLWITNSIISKMNSNLAKRQSHQHIGAIFYITLNMERNLYEIIRQLNYSEFRALWNRR